MKPVATHTQRERGPSSRAPLFTKCHFCRVIYGYANVHVWEESRHCPKDSWDESRVASLSQTLTAEDTWK